MSRPGIAFPLNGLYCKTGTGEWLNGCSRSNNTKATQNPQMNLKTLYSYSLNDENCKLEIYLGNISVKDDSFESVNLYVGDKPLNEAIANYLKTCKREQQESFIQILNDHIRKTDFAEA